MHGTFGTFRGYAYTILAILGSLIAGQASAANIQVDLNDRRQTIDGFGTTLAWFRDNVGSSTRGQYNDEAFYDLYYGDMGASLLRMEMQYTVLTPGRAVNPSNADMSVPVALGTDTYANIAKFNFDANGVGHIKRFVQQADTRAQDAFKVHGAFWSPPHWMKGPEVNWSSGQVVNASKPTWGATANSQGGTLIDTPENLEQFGRYVTAWTKGWEKATGRPLYSISLQNEATFSQFYNSAVYTPDLYVRTLLAVRDAFDAHNDAYPNDPILTKLTGPDDVGIGSRNSAFNGERAMRFVNAVNDNPEARAAMDYWVMHGFAGGVSKDGGSSSYTTWPTFFDGRLPEDGFAAPYWEGAGRDKKLWVTETSGDQGVWLTPWENDRKGGLAVGMKMFQALTAGDASAYMYWQTQLDENGSQAFGNELTAGNDPDQPKLAAFRHFSQYVRPDAVRIDLQDNDDLTYGTAFVHDDDRTLTYILFNLAFEDSEVTIDLPQDLTFTDVLGVLSEDGAYHGDMGLSLPAGDSLTFTMPRESMATLQFTYAAAVELSGDFDGSGLVEQGDLNLVLTQWGQAGTPTGWLGDGPDGVIDQAELNAVLNNWGSASPPDLQGFSTVPEPALLGLAAVGVLLNRRLRVQA
ncbi:MAG: hypothetical protein AAGJ38_02220 [Planctomycetota bacterium]